MSKRHDELMRRLAEIEAKKPVERPPVLTEEDERALDRAWANLSHNAPPAPESDRKSEKFPATSYNDGTTL